MKSYIPVFFLISFVFSNVSKTQSKETFEKFNQSIGVWISESTTQTIIEKWDRITSTKFEGLGFKVVGTDTTLTEVIELLIRNDSIFYNPRVLDQNKGEVISFKMCDYENKFRFVNLSHDFPNEIIYSFINENQLLVQLKSSTENSKEINFYFKRLNQ